MTDFDVLNSATKYPSIPTYHALDAATGALLEEPARFTGTVYLTEKVNGTSGRVVVLPSGDFLIGSREELTYARGDRIENPELGIVPALKDLAANLAWYDPPAGALVYYLEVYGHRIGGGWKQYTTGAATGFRLFDMARIPAEVLSWAQPQAVSSWREHGGQEWASETDLRRAAEHQGIPLVPRLGSVDAAGLPVTVEETPAWLTRYLPRTQVALDDSGLGDAEGIVLRNEDRTVIAKARFANYARTLQLRAGDGRARRKERSHA
jgi:hypothetical protein